MVVFPIKNHVIQEECFYERNRQNKILQALRNTNPRGRRHLYGVRSAGGGSEVRYAHDPSNRDQQRQQQRKRQCESQRQRGFRTKGLQQVGIAVSVPFPRRIRCAQVL